MAADHAAVAREMRLGARIGGASAVVTVVSLAHAVSHAHGALLPFLLPASMANLQHTHTQVGRSFSLSNPVRSSLQLGVGVRSPSSSRQLTLGIGHRRDGAVMIGTSLVHGLVDVLRWRITAHVAAAPGHPIDNPLMAQSCRAGRRVLALTGLAVYSEGSVMQTASADITDKTSLTDTLFGLYFTADAALGAPWAVRIGASVDGYGCAAACAAMAASRVAATSVLLPVCLRQTLRTAPSHA